MGTFQSTDSVTMRLPGAHAQVNRALAQAQGMRFRTVALGGLGAALDATAIGPAVVNTRELQRSLIAAGFPVGAAGADGVFGPGTVLALENFKRSRASSMTFSAVQNAEGSQVVITPKLFWDKIRSEAARSASRQAQANYDRAEDAAAGAATQLPTSSGGGVGWVGIALACLGVAGIGTAIYFSVR